MFTCFIKYVVDPNKIKEFEEYAHAWIALVKKYGGIHHGYFLPGSDSDDLPDSTFSFPKLGKNGPKDIAVALFSFPNLTQYEAYKKSVAEDAICKAITARLKENQCFSSYERSFLKPIFE